MLLVYPNKRPKKGLFIQSRVVGYKRPDMNTTILVLMDSSLSLSTIHIDLNYTRIPISNNPGPKCTGGYKMHKRKI